MTEQNPATGQPYGGRDEKPEDAALPGEREEKQDVGPPDTKPGGGHSSRAATDGPMTSEPAGDLDSTEGIPNQVDAPSPDDATDAEPPGGSAANQGGRTPDQ